MTDEQPEAVAPTGPAPSAFSVFRKRDFRLPVDRPASLNSGTHH